MAEKAIIPGPSLLIHLPKVLQAGGWEGPSPTLQFLQQGLALVLP